MSLGLLGKYATKMSQINESNENKAISYYKSIRFVLLNSLY